MPKEWIVAGVCAVLILLWCRARGAERVALAAYSGATRLRLYWPTGPWRDRIAPNDHSVLRPVRVRATVGTVTLLALLAAGSLVSNSPDPALRNVAPSNVISNPSPLPKAAPEIEVVVDFPEEVFQPADTLEPVEPIAPEVLRELRSPTGLYGSAKVKPVYRLHDVEGARITDIDSNSFWAMLGVREGDVVIELHGIPIDDATALVALMNALERDEIVEVVVRGTDGEVRYLEFRDPDDSSASSP